MGAHCIVYHRYLIVWSTTYRYKVLRGDRRLRVRENGVDIVRGVISTDHVHRFVSVPPKRAISDQVGTMKGHSLIKV
ncbi:MAG: transposase, partial [Bacteroidetes bacterium]|nr:transposase [Bacteroidota bacterium]